MKITFVSHASFIAEAGSKKILHDPWTDGKAFNNSWALLSKPYSIPYEEIDYLFISHEHPDHFSPASLKKIPETDRKRIRILYQQHASKRMVNALKMLGFVKITELSLYKWTRIEDLQFYCGSVGSMDSFLAIRDRDSTVLNMNDCVLNEHQCQYVKNEIGQVDVLLTQFSFANWVGNEKDDMQAAVRKIRDIRLQCRIYKPTHVIPFASFVFFCNSENARMNAWMNTPLKIEELGIAGLQFLYPADRLISSDPPASGSLAVTRYMNDLGSISIDPSPEPVSLEQITDALSSHLSHFRKHIGWPFRLFVAPFSILIKDLNVKLFIEPAKGTYRIITEEDFVCRYEMVSQVCWYTFRHSWGSGTLQISGMYTDRAYPEAESSYFFFQQLLSTSFISFRSLRDAASSLYFLWRKKWELIYRFI